MNLERARFRNPEREEYDVKESKLQFTELEQEVIRMHEAQEKQQKVVYRPKVYEYEAPFNYENIRVELGRTEPYIGAEYNEDGVELDVPPYGAITLVETEPIVQVTVIGSACVAPGFVWLQAEPIQWKYPRTGVKMKVDNLWGQHLRIEPWRKGIDEGWRSSGLSAAHFSLPESNKVTIMAGSQMDPCTLDVENMRHDAHYAVRIIRVTVREEVTS